METREIRDFEENSDEYQIMTIDEIKEKLNQLDISSIDIEDGEIVRTSTWIVSLLYNSYDTPIVLKKDIFLGNVLMINPRWYLENHELVDDLLAYICQNIQREDFSINKNVLISDNVIDGICENEYLRTVSLAKFEDNGYLLTRIII